MDTGAGFCPGQDPPVWLSARPAAPGRSPATGEVDQQPGASPKLSQLIEKLVSGPGSRRRFLLPRPNSSSSWKIPPFPPEGGLVGGSGAAPSTVRGGQRDSAQNHPPGITSWAGCATVQTERLQVSVKTPPWPPGGRG